MKTFVKDKLEVEIFENRTLMGEAAAKDISGKIKELLAEKQEIPTAFGETLSWKYLTYVRAHPIAWHVPTRILYGAHDDLTAPETISAFARRVGAELTVMPDGEHWFHTEEQLRFLDAWITEGAGR